MRFIISFISIALVAVTAMTPGVQEHGGGEGVDQVLAGNGGEQSQRTEVEGPSVDLNHRAHDSVQSPSAGSQQSSVHSSLNGSPNRLEVTDSTVVDGVNSSILTNSEVVSGDSISTHGGGVDSTQIGVEPHTPVWSGGVEELTATVDGGINDTAVRGGQHVSVAGEHGESSIAVAEEVGGGPGISSDSHGTASGSNHPQVIDLGPTNPVEREEGVHMNDSIVLGRIFESVINGGHSSQDDDGSGNTHNFSVEQASQRRSATLPGIRTDSELQGNSNSLGTDRRSNSHATSFSSPTNGGSTSRTEEVTGGSTYLSQRSSSNDPHQVITQVGAAAPVSPTVDIVGGGDNTPRVGDQGTSTEAVSGGIASTNSQRFSQNDDSAEILRNPHVDDSSTGSSIRNTQTGGLDGVRSGVSGESLSNVNSGSVPANNSNQGTRTQGQGGDNSPSLRDDTSSETLVTQTGQRLLTAHDSPRDSSGQDVRTRATTAEENGSNGNAGGGHTGTPTVGAQETSTGAVSRGIANTNSRGHSRYNYIADILDPYVVRGNSGDVAVGATTASSIVESSALQTNVAQGGASTTQAGVLNGVRSGESGSNQQVIPQINSSSAVIEDSRTTSVTHLTPREQVSSGSNREPVSTVTTTDHTQITPSRSTEETRSSNQATEGVGNAVLSQQSQRSRSPDATPTTRLQTDTAGSGHQEGEVGTTAHGDQSGSNYSKASFGSAHTSTEESPLKGANEVTPSGDDNDKENADVEPVVPVKQVNAVDASAAAPKKTKNVSIPSIATIIATCILILAL